jgi:hypothetical protein
MVRIADKRSNRVQRRAAKFANHTNESGWETLAQHRMIARLWKEIQFPKCNLMIDTVQKPSNSVLLSQLNSLVLSFILIFPAKLIQTDPLQFSQVVLQTFV